MTMQIAIHARDGFVLASDIKNRINKDPEASSYTYHSKIVQCQKHGLIAAMMGFTADPDADPAEKLMRHLEACTTSTRKEILQWAHGYVADRKTHNAVDSFSLLLVHPASPHDYLWKLKIVGDNVSDSSSFRWLALHGHENNPAILWPEYFKCEGKCNLQEATNIAALTILMAGDVNPYGVRGLEIFRYASKWETVSPSEMERIGSKYEELKLTLQRFTSAG
jgi:hypothetical protein